MAQSLQKRSEHAFDFTDTFVQPIVCLALEVSKVERQKQLILHFAGRPHRNLQKSSKVRIAVAATSFRDI